MNSRLDRNSIYNLFKFADKTDLFNLLQINKKFRNAIGDKFYDDIMDGIEFNELLEKYSNMIKNGNQRIADYSQKFIETIGASPFVQLNIPNTIPNNYEDLEEQYKSVVSQYNNEIKSLKKDIEDMSKALGGKKLKEIIENIKPIKRQPESPKLELKKSVEEILELNPNEDQPLAQNPNDNYPEGSTSGTDYFGQPSENMDPQSGIPLDQIFTKRGVTFEGTTIKANLVGSYQEKKDKCEQIAKYFDQLIEKIPSTENLVYKFKFSGLGWRTFMLNTADSITKFKQTLQDVGVYNLQEVNNEAQNTFYEKGEPPKLIFVDAIWIGINILQQDSTKKYKTTGGSFFPYRLLPEFDYFAEYLEKAQIFMSLVTQGENNKGIMRPEFELNCFCYALQQAGVPEDLLNTIRRHCRGRYQKAKHLDKVCKYMNICVKILKETKQAKNNIEKPLIFGCEPKDAKFYCEMFLIRDLKMKGSHYVYNCDVPVSSFFLKNRVAMINYALEKNKPISDMFNKQRFNVKKNVYEVKSKNASIKLSELILHIRDNDGFYPYSYSDVLPIFTDLSEYVINKDNTLHYHDYECILMNQIKKEPKTKTVPKTPKSFWYADFECSTQGIHKPYCVAFSNRNDKNIECIYGHDCAYEFLKQIPDNAVVYFHNLSYDGRFLAKYGVINAIKKGSKFMSMRISIFGKKILLKDSYAMIPMKLASFPESFDIKDVKKEMYPYNYYTTERINYGIGRICQAGKFECKPWTINEYSQISIKGPPI